MSIAEELATGCANHMYTGDILARAWELGEDLCRVIARHHTPSAEDHLARLICLADFVGGIVCPFPRKAAYPHVEFVQAQLIQGDASLTLDEGKTKQIKAFLPAGFLEGLGVGLKELLDLSRALFPVGQQFVERMRAGIRLKEKTEEAE